MLLFSITFKAIDIHSGVDIIAYNITIITPGKHEAIMYTGTEPANKKPVNNTHGKSKSKRKRYAYPRIVQVDLGTDTLYKTLFIAMREMQLLSIY